jgi:hypothetical protein
MAHPLEELLFLGRNGTTLSHLLAAMARIAFQRPAVRCQLCSPTRSKCKILLPPLGDRDPMADKMSNIYALEVVDN